MADFSKIYRYSTLHWNKELIDKGSVRIGTLHNYRKDEHGRGISDAEEGKKNVSHYIKEANLSSPITTPRQQKDFDSIGAFDFIRFPDGMPTNFHMSDVSFHKQIESPDFYIYCSSSRCSMETMQQFEKADSCILISDANAFYERLTVEISKTRRVKFLGAHVAIYTSRDERWNGVDWGTHPALIKDPIFQPQYEVRAIWEPIDKTPISCLFFEDTGLTKHCSFVEPT